MTARHYSNSQNLVISFEYSWFLAKNLSNFVTLAWKLHNRKCHILQPCSFLTIFSKFFLIKFHVVVLLNWAIISSQYFSPLYFAIFDSKIFKIQIFCFTFHTTNFNVKSDKSQLVKKEWKQGCNSTKGKEVWWQKAETYNLCSHLVTNMINDGAKHFMNSQLCPFPQNH